MVEVGTVLLLAFPNSKIIFMKKNLLLKKLYKLK